MKKEPIQAPDALGAIRKETQKTFQFFLIAIILSFPFFIQIISLAFGYHFELIPMWQVFLATLVQFGCGWLFYKDSYKAIKAKKGSVDLLIALGTTAAYSFSLVVYLWHLPYASYFGSSTVIITLSLWGRWLEAVIKEKTTALLEKLLQLKSNQTNVRDWVERIQYSRASIQHLADQVAAIFIPIILLISLLTWIGWSLGNASHSTRLVNAIAVLIIACPCVLTLATPLVLLISNKLARQYKILWEKDSPLAEIGVTFIIGKEQGLVRDAIHLGLINQDSISLANANDLSRMTMRKIRQNIFLAFAYNILTIPLAVTGLLNSSIVAGTMVMSLVSIIVNALLLRYWKPRSQESKE